MTSNLIHSSSRRRVGALALTVAFGLSAAACGSTIQGVKEDTASAADNVAGAAQTVDVKSALIADDRIDTDDINVDTNADTNTVTLKGSVPTIEQKQLAEQIARKQAGGYRVVNQLVVKPLGG